MEIVEKVKELAANYLEANGIELVNITYRREQGRMTLRLLVDKDGGIRLGECEELNHYLSRILDEKGIIEERYLLEVSSPGLDRPFRTERDYVRAIGKVIELTAFEPIDGRKTHEGMLVGMDEESVVMESNGVSTVIPKNKIAMARLKIEF